MEILSVFVAVGPEILFHKVIYNKSQLEWLLEN